MRRLCFHTVVIAGFTLLTILLTYPLILHLTTHIPVHKDWHPSGSEHWMWLWAFWFIEHCIVELHQWPLFTDTIFYPRGIDLTNTMLLGFGHTLAVALPFVHYVGVILPFNGLLIVTFILNAYFTFLLVQYLTDDSRAAFIAAIVFAFSPYQMARTVSMFGLATSSMWIPLYILFFIRAARSGFTRYLVLAPLVLTVTVVSHPYYTVFLSIFSGIYAGYELIIRKDRSLRMDLLRRFLWMGCLSLLFFLPLSWVMLAHWSKDLQIEAPLSAEFGADLLAFFLPATHHTIVGNIIKSISYTHFTGNDAEQTVYIGYMVLLLASIAVVKVPKEQTRFWSLAALIFFVLSLGPILHIGGKSLLHVYDVPIMLPLPSILLYLLPLLRGVRGYSRFSIMLMLALAVLAGYGTRYVLARVESRPRAALACIGLIGLAIGVEFSTIPLPLADARIPTIYAKIASEGGADKTLLDVPLYWFMTQYEYYQTAHLKRLLSGQVPRIPLRLNQTYADMMPLIKLFRNPALINDYEHFAINHRDVQRFIEFFDLSFIVIHKALLQRGLFDHLLDLRNRPPGEVLLPGPEVFERLMRYLLSNFPVTHVEEEGDIVVLHLGRSPQDAALWFDRGTYQVDFGSTGPQTFLSEGWADPERWSNGLTVAWAADQESRLWLYFPRVEDLGMELRLRPFTFPGSPVQTVKLYVNGNFIQELLLEVKDWQNYTVRLPAGYLTTGINTVRFVYKYTEAPARVEAKNADHRTLAVAFDYIVFRQNEGG